MFSDFKTLSSLELEIKLILQINIIKLIPAPKTILFFNSSNIFKFSFLFLFLSVTVFYF